MVMERVVSGGKQGVEVVVKFKLRTLNDKINFQSVGLCRMKQNFQPSFSALMKRAHYLQTSHDALSWPQPD